MLLVIRDDEPVFGIGVASHLTKLPVWTLRMLDKQLIVRPKKTRGNTRLYSNNDLQQLCRARYYLEVKKVNIAGLRMLKELIEDW